MSSSSIQMLVSMVLYISIVIFIGVYFAKRANESSENYYLGGRSLGPWVTAFSAEASDMSGYLLMGVPGLAYWTGLADAFWTAIGLAIGTYVNWLIVAKRLRKYSHVAGNSITIPDFFSNRFHEKKKLIMGISSIFILVFFTVYAASCFVTCGKLLLIVTLVVGTLATGGIGVVLDNLKNIPGFLEFFQVAVPATNELGEQMVENGAPLFLEAGKYSILQAASMLAWGLGYFGMPQVLLRFMAIRKSDELTKSRRIATIWVVISLFSAVAIGMMGRAFAPTGLNTASSAENIFSLIASTLMHPLIAGIVMAGILAATISSSDSYLLIAASAFSKNLYQGIFKKDASDNSVMKMSRGTLIIISIIGALIALDENSVIFSIVSFAWAGFGATFGPLMLFSLFWKRTTREGAIAGMIAGGAMVFIWYFLIKPLGGVFGIYELLPSFLFSALVIVIVSLMTKEPDEEIQKEFEEAKYFEC